MGKGDAGLLLWRAGEATVAVKSMTVGFVDSEDVEGARSSPSRSRTGPAS
ncbi:hypothetical protein [Streptomyces aquilus]